MIFKIIGMDCAEESTILKRELGPLLGGEECLEFDLINGKMVVNLPHDSTEEKEIIQRVRTTGMQAIPWEQHRTHSKSSGASTFMGRHGRALMCSLSGLTLIFGFALHALPHGVADAFASGGRTAHQFPVSAVILYLISLTTGAWYVLPKALYSMRSLRPDMNLLMIIAVVGAVAIGEWFEAAVVAFLFSLALLLEAWSIGRARRAINSLMDLSPPKARIIDSESGNIEEKLVGNVSIGAVVIVRPGEKIPLDGTITKGETNVNQAPITGESKPIHKTIGDDVFAGTINNEGAIEFKVAKEASDTTLARIIKMVEQAQSRRARSEQWVEKFARYYTPAMIALALVVAVCPPVMIDGNWGKWIYQALVILVIACPCALVISTPVSIVAGLTAAARNGVLIKGGVFLEEASRLKAIVLDKTGTITRAQPVVQILIPLNEHSEEQLLEIAAAIEFHSEHQLAKAVLKRARADGLTVTPADNYTMLAGKGGEATIDGRPFWIGSHRLMHEKNLETGDVHHTAEKLEQDGFSVVALGNDRHVCGLIAIADEIRDEAKDCIHDLKKTGIHEIIMLTGDNEGTARTVAKATGIDSYSSELLPEDKMERVKALVARYQHVAMVGDGINDAPSMATATLGIAMGSAGTDAAIETADIALMSDDLSKLPWLVKHSRRTLRTIKCNIVFSLMIKAVFMILAVFGLATLWAAIAADMGASLLVTFNGLRLLREVS